MKINHYFLTMALFIIGLQSSIAQSGQKWATGGNSVGTGDFIGTTNGFSLIFKTNNTQQMSIDPKGNIQITAFSTGKSGIISFDGKGNLTQLSFTGNSTDILTGSGSFTSFSKLSPWQQNGSNLYYWGGNVGIGAGGFPTHTLEVNGTMQINGDVTMSNFASSGTQLVAADATGHLITLGQPALASIMYPVAPTISCCSSTCQPYWYTGAGIPSANVSVLFTTCTWVGIGTAAPIVPLDVVGTIYASDAVRADGIITAGTGINAVSMGGSNTLSPYFGENYLGFNTTRDQANLQWVTGTDGSSNGGAVIMTNAAGEIRFANIVQTNNAGTGGTQQHLSDAQLIANSSMVISPYGGGVFIRNPLSSTCTQSPSIALTANNTYPLGQFLLAVAGGIITTEVLVQPCAGTWCDYVFAKDYKMRTLKELEQYIAENQHLPDVPSSSEVKDNGIKVAEMDAVLLKKIEELTLYTIALQKQIDSMKDEISKLKQGN